MKPKKNRGILLFGFSLMLCAILIVSLTSLSCLKEVGRLFAETYSHSFANWVESEQTLNDVTSLHRAMKDILTTKSDADFEMTLLDVNKYDLSIKEHLNNLKNNYNNADNRLLLEVAKSYDEWEPIRDKIIKLSKNADYNLDIENAVKFSVEQVSKINDKIKLFIEFEKNESEKAFELSKDTSKNAITNLLLLTLYLVVLTSFISFDIRTRLSANAKELQEEKEQLRITFESIGDGVITTDTNKNILKLNKIAEKMTGWTTEEAVGSPFLDVFKIMTLTSDENPIDPVDHVLKSDKIFELANHTSLASKDGSKIQIEHSAAPIKDQNGNTTGVVIVFRDVTEKIIANDKLEERDFLLRESQKVAHIGSYTNDVVNGTWKSSEELDNIFGIDESFDHSLENFLNIVHIDSKSMVSDHINSVYSGKKRFDFQYKIKRVNDGVERWVHGIGELKLDKNGNAVKMIGTIQDITDYKKAANEIEYISYHDSLTRLYNRRKFEMTLESIEASKIFPVSIIMGDVNGLKLVNDAFGHTNGDNILIRVAQIMSEECGVSAYVARHGGDEFVAILPGIDYLFANLIIKKIRNRCLDETTIDLMLNISFGTATKESENDSLKKCYYLAEERMYASKLLETKSTRSAIIANLRTVMEEKTGETQKHCERISEMAQKIGDELQMQSFEVEYLKLLALLHDIGKTGVPDGILLKPDKLTKEEWKTMERHCEIGFRIANTMPELVPISDGILSHHERWDGSGYPHGLKGSEIPLMARIISVIDSYDAMVNDRPYRKAISIDDAVNELKLCSGTQFDPEVVKLFIEKVLLKNY